MYPESEVSDDEVRKRYMKLYDLKHSGPEFELKRFKKKLCSLSWYVKEIKQGFSRYFNNSTFGVPKVEKSEIRISKFETNPNFLMLK